MAVIVQAFEFVILRDYVESEYPGGVPAFCEAVPNNTYCSDNRLIRIGFMVKGDRDHFIRELNQRLPITRTTSAQLSPREMEVPNWLASGTCAGWPAVWLRGYPADPLTTPLWWTPNGIKYRATDDVEFVRRDGDVIVGRDRQTGEAVYSGRTQPEPEDLDYERLNQVYVKSVSIIDEFINLADRQGKALGFWGKRRLRKALRGLEGLVEQIPEHWNSWFFLGMGRRRLGEHESARDAFERAYRSNPGHKDLARELIGQHLKLGETKPAVELSRTLHEGYPDDISLQTNYAVALLLDAQLKRAAQVAKNAVERDPEDPINRNLVKVIDEIANGRRPQPRSLLELEGG